MIANLPIPGRKLLPAAVALTGLLGAMVAGFDLYRAVQTVRWLYSAGITGLSIEGDLVYATQESRRQSLYAITTTDPNLQRPYIDRARSADREVDFILDKLAQLQLGERVQRSRESFAAKWHSYLSVRDKVTALLLAGRQNEAVALDMAQGDPKFQAVCNEMRSVKEELDYYGREQTIAVRMTFYRTGLELLVLLASTVLFVFVLVRTLAALRQNNELIAKSRSIEQSRNRILEMVGKNEPQDVILDALVRYLENQYPGAKVILSLVDGDRLRIEAAPELPEEVRLQIDSIPLDIPEASFGRAPLPSEPTVVADIHHATEWVPHRDLAIRHGLKACWWSLVTSSTGGTIGLIAMFHSSEALATDADKELLAGATRLAALALEHCGLYQQLAHQALHDPLTELPNRLLFQDRLQQALSRAHRNSRRVAVLWIDLDHFKQINDTLGHRAGDVLLRQISHRLSGCVRKSDTVARLGGDEFTIILNDLEDSRAASEITRNVLTRLQAPITLSDRQVAITASVGVSIFPDHGEDASTLVKNADIAMYQAKKSGKNTFRTYAPDMGQLAREHLDIAMQLRTALENGEFEIHYQPQLTLEGEMVGFEALLRWTNPLLGRVSPSQFIPIAEETGRIIAIGEWTLKQACLQNAAWQRAGYRPVRVAVNVSALQLARPEFVSSVEEALRLSGLQPQYLDLELTEIAVMHNVEEASRQFARLRALGVSVSIDDFGTGYSSLTYLNSLPVNYVKVDQSFLRQLSTNSPGSLSLIRTIISMAHSMDLQVIAEGVETQNQLEALNNTGCDLAQGFLLHKPLTTADAEKLLEGMRPAQDQTDKVETPALAVSS